LSSCSRCSSTASRAPDPVAVLPDVAASVDAVIDDTEDWERREDDLVGGCARCTAWFITIT